MYPRMPMPPVYYQQYQNAYPVIHYQQPPSAANGYGWHGNGYGWQLDPKAWHTPPLYPSVNDQVIEEPVIQAEKVEKQNAWNLSSVFGTQRTRMRKSVSPRRLNKMREPPKRVIPEICKENHLFMKVNLDNLKKRYVPFENIPDSCSTLCKSICKKVNNSEAVADTKLTRPIEINPPRPSDYNSVKAGYKNCQIIIDQQNNEYSFKLWNPNASQDTKKPSLVHLKFENGVLKNQVTQNYEGINILNEDKSNNKNTICKLDEENKSIQTEDDIHQTEDILLSEDVNTKCVNTDPFEKNEEHFVKIDKRVLEKNKPHRLIINPLGSKYGSKPSSLPKKKKVVGHKDKNFFDLSLKDLNVRGFRGMYYKFGEHGSGFKSRSEPQDFYKLRDEHLENGTLFEDPEFPANDMSLYFSQRPDRHFEWKRPSEIVENPQLFVEGFSRFDVQQGELGDCWLLAATANLTLYRRLFFQIVPDDQDFDDKYAGIFHFRFWQYGRWIDVVIDDRLPTYHGQLVFLHSTEDNEFWSALLEKAYAKLHGSYEALKGGSTCEAMEDFTGGVTEMYEMEASPPNLFQIMIKAYERASLMGCSIEPDPNVLEAQTPEGLVRGHAYSITRVQYVDIQTPNTSGKIPLLRLRNPWGNESEWNGPWSDGAPEWRFISESDKEELGLTFDNDGEFWMSYRDFAKYFSRVEICNLNPDSLSEEELQEGNKKKWEMSVYEGKWVRGVTAGGCRNFIDTFTNNPQYRVTLTEVDEGDEDGNCTVIVALMQKNRRQMRQSSGVDLLTIGFAIYHLPYPDRVPKPLDLNFFKYNASVARSPSFINLREVSCRFKLPPGTYCIVPSTFDPNEEGEFLLRVFSENQNNMVYDGSLSDNSYSRSARDVDEDEDNDEAPSYRPPSPPSAPSYPSYPSHPEPSSPYSPQPQPSYPGYPQSPGGYPYPNPSYQPNPSYPNYAGYPQNPQYPGYPSNPGYSSNPQYPGYPSNPQYPGYPQPQPPPRSSSRGDPILNFFNKLFK